MQGISRGFLNRLHVITEKSKGKMTGNKGKCEIPFVLGFKILSRNLKNQEVNSLKAYVCHFPNCCQMST